MNSIQKITTIIIFSFTSLITAQETESHTHDHSKHGSHAPIGVMGDHTMKKGEFMFSYRYMLMGMDGMLDGNNEISNADVMSRGYMVTPTEMTMQMHMIGAMYAPSDRVTLTAMASYRANDMDLIIIGNGTEFSTSASGIGDTKLGALVNLIEKGNHKIHANVGLSIPTGSINNRDDVPVLDDALLAYPMQTGTGTWDTSMGLTYTGYKGLLGWGAQTLYTQPLGKNNKDYTVGAKAEATIWGTYQATDFVSFSARLKYMQTGAINGSASELSEPTFRNDGVTPIVFANFAPIFNTVNSGRKQLDVNVGSSFMLDFITEGLRFGAEVGLPVYQDVNGVQMDNQFMGTIGLQYAL